MIAVLKSTQKLQLATSSAANVDSVVFFMDATNANPPVVQGDTSSGQFVSISAATTTDVCAAPASGELRNIKAATWRNKHASTANDITVILDDSGTDYELHKVTLAAGEMLSWTENLGFFHYKNPVDTELFKVLDASATGQNANTAQPWFPTAGGVTVEAGARYHFAGMLYLTRSAGTTSHTTGLGFGGTATITDFLARYNCGEGDVATLADDDAIQATSVANLQVKGASTSATEVIKVLVHGTVTINAAGTFIPQFTYSTAPGGAPTIVVGTYFRMQKYTNTTKGSWS